ncbi:hypothetical protein D9M68_929720 [compost metagenome]
MLHGGFLVADAAGGDAGFTPMALLEAGAICHGQDGAAAKGKVVLTYWSAVGIQRHAAQDHLGNTVAHRVPPNFTRARSRSSWKRRTSAGAPSRA